jgi:hypothetical protein
MLSDATWNFIIGAYLSIEAFDWILFLEAMDYPLFLVRNRAEFIS